MGQWGQRVGESCEPKGEERKDLKGIFFWEGGISTVGAEEKIISLVQVRLQPVLHFLTSDFFFYPVSC